MIPSEELTTDGIDRRNRCRHAHAGDGEQTESAGTIEATAEDHAALPGGVQTSSGAAAGAGGAPAAQTARELGASPDTLRAWAKQLAIDAGQRDGLTTDERRELGRLRREVRRLREEREILKKAAAFFAAGRATR